MKASLALHAKYRGKLETVALVPLRNRRDLSLSYTPGVAAVCRAIAERPKSIGEYTLQSRTVAVVTDGSAILGLGNLGPRAALPVMEGKAILFKQFGGVDAFPICLDTQDSEEIIRCVKAIAPVFGGINLEDIAAPRCFEIEARLQRELSIPVMHDDQHGTAVVVLAAFMNALKIKNMNPGNVRVVVNGAGAAGMAVTELLLRFGVRDLVLVDSQGAIFMGRPGLTPEKSAIARRTNRRRERGELATVIADKDCFIGVSKAGLLTGEMVRTMRPQPIIFALANPTPEIMPDEAKAAGAFIVATGRSDFPNQINNVLAFPGLFRGALTFGTRRFTEQHFLKAARAIAGCVVQPRPNKIIPDPFDRRVARSVAQVFQRAV